MVRATTHGLVCLDVVVVIASAAVGARYLPAVPSTALGGLYARWVIAYLLIVYGLGGGWLWWLAFARGSVQAIGGLILAIGTVVVVGVQRRRSRSLSSQWEWIPQRAITHGGPITSSRWNRDRSERPDDPDDFEAHVGGGF